MKYSGIMGAAACIIIIAACYMPWVYIPSLQADLTGMNTANTNFGKPGYLNIIFSSVALILFLIPALWAKRVNIFIVALNMAWAIRNFILFSLCESGECPEKKTGVYLNLTCSILILIMALFPAVSGNKNKE